MNFYLLLTVISYTTSDVTCEVIYW